MHRYNDNKVATLLLKSSLSAGCIAYVFLLKHALLFDFYIIIDNKCI